MRSGKPKVGCARVTRVLKPPGVPAPFFPVAASLVLRQLAAASWQNSIDNFDSNSNNVQKQGQQNEIHMNRGLMKTAI
jgi:hypothetical protein